MSRTVTLVLVDADGVVRGTLPPFEARMPYWQEASDVVAAAKESFGLDVTVLRLLSHERPAPRGGAVTYLAEAAVLPAELGPAPELDLSPHPRRAAYAEPGGPAETLRWAASALAEAGRPAHTVAHQQRTWNLSAIWRLDTPAGPVWLKQVPVFFAHEAAVLRHLGRGPHASLVPSLIAGAHGRMLLDHLPGDDLYGAGPDVRDAIAGDLHAIQLTAATELDTLRALGVPDRRGSALVRFCADVVAAHPEHTDDGVRALVDGLPARLAEVAACGLPDTLVHGDLHPGNARGDAQRRVILDWGDCVLGHPAFDILRLTEQVPADDERLLLDAWVRRWRAAVPGSDPARAVELLRPVVALRNAAAYAGFLAAIEPTEHPYHADDVPFWLAQAAEAARA
ncbi:aminoglycoside phosphotransferase family protein [Catellatospora tritici]|uniref:aminoglycoside phosphotransferase family protein n=1 Tax=Catellatospora tritici TaxID=2851566 RepID=UPI001C2DCFDD|nr:aminoglycoside phosphotransferase family protein [Catellatospora tritici]MBV1856168.1 aminoglycoside phosphotransferase family protein [Catellatospora tritici]